MTDAALEAISTALGAYTRADATGTAQEQIRAYNVLCDTCFEHGCPVDVDEPADWASFHVTKWLVEA
jgi:hypothetical protein